MVAKFPRKDAQPKPWALDSCEQIHTIFDRSEAADFCANVRHEWLRHLRPNRDFEE
jgi:hypothetical protein